MLWPWLRAAAVLLFYLACSAALFRAAWAAPETHSIGYYADPQQFMWFLGWISYALSHGQNPFISTYVNYPYGVNLLWNTSVLLPGAALAPLTDHFGPIVAYNTLVTLALPLSAWCAYLALGRWVRSHIAAAAGGLLYGFSPYMTAQALTHPHLVVALAPPLLLLLLDELLVRQRRQAIVVGAALGVLGAAQLLTGEEMLATMALAAVLGAILLALLRPGEVHAHVRYAAAGFAVAGVVFAILAAGPLWLQFEGPQRALGSLHAGRPYVADLLNVVVPSRTQLVIPEAARRISNHFNASPAEQDAYIGLPLLLLLIGIAALWWSRPLVRWAALLALLLAVLALGGRLEVGGHVTNIPLPWLLFAQLPLLKEAITGRLMLYVFLLAALLAALLLDHLPGLSRPWQLAVAGSTALALLALTPRFDYPATLKVPPPFFNSAALDRVPAGSVALVAPFAALSHGTFSGATAAMLWQSSARMRFSMPEGYVFVPRLPPQTGSDLRPPPSTTQSVMIAIMQGQRAPAMTAALRHRLWTELRRWRVRTVIVGPMINGPRMLTLFTRLFQRFPERVQGVYVWWHV